MESIRLFMCALLLTPAVALAQAEEPEAAEAPVEEVPVDEAAPADEAAVEEVPAEGMSSDDAAAAEQSAGEETAEAAGPRGGHHVDVFYIGRSEIQQQIGASAGDEHGGGFGARGLFRFMQHFAASGEYQSQKFGDDDEIELTQQRLGVGFVGDDNDGGFFGLFIEADKLKLENTVTNASDDADGYSLHARLSGNSTEWLGFFGDLGYLRVETDDQDYSGHELSLGAMFRIGEFGVFIDGRRTDLEGKDIGDRLAITEARVGVRFEFGAIRAE